MVRKADIIKRVKRAPEELRELILQAAKDLIEERGLEGLSAREIARKIEYSPGTLYNVFKDRDEIILTLESRLLDELLGRLKSAQGCPDTRKRVVCLANAYVEFSSENPKLWSLLSGHRLNDSKEAPDWYQLKMDKLMQCLEEALLPLMEGSEKSDVSRSARVLWAGLHGITSLAVAGKLSTVSSEPLNDLADNFVETYLEGLPPASQT